MSEKHQLQIALALVAMMNAQRLATMALAGAQAGFKEDMLGFMAESNKNAQVALGNLNNAVADLEKA